MKKLTVAAFALAMTFGAHAQTAQTSQGGGSGAGGGAAAYGSVSVAMVTALGVTLAVATAIVANSQDVVVPIITDPTNPGFDLICNEGDAEPVGGVCTNNGVTVTVTGTGTNTSTITVPVVTTYPAIVVPRT